jgi:hypothetical protein
MEKDMIFINSILEESEVGINSLCVANNPITKACFERIVKLCNNHIWCLQPDKRGIV